MFFTKMKREIAHLKMRLDGVDKELSRKQETIYRLQGQIERIHNYLGVNEICYAGTKLVKKDGPEKPGEG